MAPIYDTDIAEQRWDRTDWENYELWEKVIHRRLRNRRLWCLATALVFVALSAVPIVLDRSGKWATLGASRRLAEALNRLKFEAGRDHAAYRLRFGPDGRLEYQVERARSCSDPHPQVVRGGSLFADERLPEYALLTPAEAGIPGLIREICYDYLAGSDAVLRGEEMVGFGIIPVKDLAGHRQDRLSILLINGPSAEASFD